MEPSLHSSQLPKSKRLKRETTTEGDIVGEGPVKEDPAGEGPSSKEDL